MLQKRKYQEVCNVKSNGSWQTQRSNSIARDLKAKHNADEYLKAADWTTVLLDQEL
jgi:hypothetical protein